MYISICTKYECDTRGILYGVEGVVHNAQQFGHHPSVSHLLH